MKALCHMSPSEVENYMKFEITESQRTLINSAVTIVEALGCEYHIAAQNGEVFTNEVETLEMYRELAAERVSASKADKEVETESNKTTVPENGYRFYFKPGTTGNFLWSGSGLNNAVYNFSQNLEETLVLDMSHLHSEQARKSFKSAVQTAAIAVFGNGNYKTRTDTFRDRLILEKK